MTLPRRQPILLALLLLALIGASLPGASQEAPFDVAIVGGRVIDPASGGDRVASVGIRDGRIAAIRDRRLRGRLTLDAAGLVVAPGFIDILGATSDTGDPYKIADGVTTVIGTHGGPVDFPAWLREQRARRPVVNYGTTTGHGALREAAGAVNRNAPATPAQVERMAVLADQAIRDGALGVGFGIEYVPGTSGQEVVALAQVAARHEASIHAHIRLPHVHDPFQGINELIAASATTGVRSQVMHIGSMTIERTRESLALIDAARARGIDIAADVYPYTAWMGPIGSALFDPGWQEKYALDYDDLVWAATGERITAETFPRLRAQGGSVIVHQMRDADVEAALRHPVAAVASDGAIRDGPANHPRDAGTFCRVLGVYVREKRVLTLTEALRKMTSLPASRLAPGSAALRRKGRLAVGMDADVTVFDAATVIDRATYQNAAQRSAGVRHVLVNGVPVLRDGELIEGARPGRAILSDASSRGG